MNRMRWFVYGDSDRHVRLGCLRRSRRESSIRGCRGGAFSRRDQSGGTGREIVGRNGESTLLATLKLEHSQHLLRDRFLALDPNHPRNVPLVFRRMRDGHDLTPILVPV
jgi:hypothetical protein